MPKSRKYTVRVPDLTGSELAYNTRTFNTREEAFALASRFGADGAGRLQIVEPWIDPTRRDCIINDVDELVSYIMNTEELYKHAKYLYDGWCARRHSTADIELYRTEEWIRHTALKHYNSFVDRNQKLKINRRNGGLTLAANQLMDSGNW